MPFRVLSAAMDNVARRLGYVPKHEHDQLIAKLEHKTRNLEAQIVYRDRLEKEIGFLRELELIHARKESGTQQAVQKLEDITSRLTVLMQDNWPSELLLEEAKTAA